LRRPRMLLIDPGRGRRHLAAALLAAEMLDPHARCGHIPGP
jgi:hypothetical protein